MVIALRPGMPVSGLVILLEPSVASTEELPSLLTDPRVELGAIQGRRLPIVLETASLEEAERFVESLVETHGIGRVDVVSVDFSDASPAPGALS